MPTRRTRTLPPRAESATRGSEPKASRIEPKASLARPKAKVTVQRASRAKAIPATARLRAWARAACRGAAEVTLRVVDAAEARRLNRSWRGRDAPTNVLSFGYSRRPCHGDIVLCHPLLAREARAQGKRLDAHYAHLVVHGVLHLRGYDHLRAAQAQRMERLERRLLARLGFPDPYGSSVAAHVRMPSPRGRASR